MTHHLTLSTASRHARNQGDEVEAASNRARAGDGEANLSVAAHSGPHPTLASTPVWRHRLILTGKLDYRSASELEEEIECLCQEGVTNLTLDLRPVSSDSQGLASANLPRLRAACGARCSRPADSVRLGPVMRHVNELGVAVDLESQPSGVVEEDQCQTVVMSQVSGTDVLPVSAEVGPRDGVRIGSADESGGSTPELDIGPAGSINGRQVEPVEVSEELALVKSQGVADRPGGFGTAGRPGRRGR